MEIFDNEMGLYTLIVLGLAFLQGAEAGKKVFCYFSSSSNARGGIGKFWPENIDPYLCTHLIFAFADIAEGGKGLEPNNWNDLGKHGLYMRTHKLKEINPKLKLILAVGGWRIGSLPFLPVIATLESMRLFAARVVHYLRHYGFDGMDMDWEFPGIRGSQAEDKYKFTELMKTIQRAFEVDALRRRAPKLLLTMAAAASKYYAEIAYEQDKLWLYVDYVLLMTYNYHGANWENVTGHHSALLPHRLDKDADRQHNFVWSVEYWLRSGIPPEKLCVGLATYGISFKLADPKHHGVRAPVLGPGSPGPHTNESGILAYYEICDALENRGWQLEWIDDQYVPYAHGQGDWVGFENQDSLIIKMNDVLKRGLGGVLVWSIEMDDFTGHCNEGRFPLLRAINNVLKPSYDSDDLLDDGLNTPRGSPPRGKGGLGNIKKSEDIVQDRPKSTEVKGSNKVGGRPKGSSQQLESGGLSVGRKQKQGPTSSEGGLSSQNEMRRFWGNDTDRNGSNPVTTEYPPTAVSETPIFWNPWITQYPPSWNRQNSQEKTKNNRQDTNLSSENGDFKQIRSNFSEWGENQTFPSFNSSNIQDLRNMSRGPPGEIHFETTTTFDNVGWPETNTSEEDDDPQNETIPEKENKIEGKKESARIQERHNHQHNDSNNNIDNVFNSTTTIEIKLNDTSQIDNLQNITSKSDDKHNMDKNVDSIIEDSILSNQSESSTPSTKTRPQEVQQPGETPEFSEDLEKSESESNGDVSDYSWYDYWDSEHEDSDWSESDYDSEYDYSHEGDWYDYSSEYYDSDYGSEDYYYSEPGEFQEEPSTSTESHDVDHHENIYDFDCNEHGLGIYKDPTSCIHFIMCVPMTIWHLGPLKMDCPSGTRFDDNLKVCNYEYMIPCDD
ncbi:uncharacterized protein LOC135467029 [Liolophura sinensis]|uniref:uncharacterized protein LOC135467029 n=1 Tax=Liolophura sinensis TaxID=3198878 RepID=UPI00315860BE